MDILSATILECLNTTLSVIYSVLQLHLCPWCSKDQPDPGPSLAPRDYQEAERPELDLKPHPQEVNYLTGKEAPSSVLINYLRRCNYSEHMC